MFLTDFMVDKHFHKNSKGQSPPPAPTPDHKAMIEAIADHQDRTAFIELFNHFAPRIKSFMMKGGASEGKADELAQETMLSVWTKAASYDPAKAAPSTWIFTIARNKRIDAIRKTNYAELYPEDTDVLEDTAPYADENISHDEETRILAHAIATLPEDQAELLKKSFFEGKSHAQIAEETNLPLGTIKSRIRLALEKLRQKQEIKTLW